MLLTSTDRGTYALVHEVEFQDLIDNSIAQDHTGWVAHPSVSVLACTLSH